MKPFCEKRWKLEGSIYLILVLAMLGYALYIFYYKEGTQLFYEIVDRKYGKSSESTNPTARHVKGMNVNLMYRIEDIQLESVANIKGVLLKASSSTPVELGSGIVIHRQGYVLTNQHIVEHATNLKVTLLNRKTTPKTYKAVLIKVNDTYDLALLKIVSKKRFTPAFLGSMPNAHKGEKVFALGNPYGKSLVNYPGTVVYSNKTLHINNRNIPSLIIVDNRINWQNSGGPLINSRGETIGVNTAIYSGKTQMSVNAVVPLGVCLDAFKDVMDKPNYITNYNKEATIFETSAGYGIYKYAGLFLLGFISGIMGGMFSMGGGILLVSGLIFIFHYGIIIIRPIAYIANFFTSGAAVQKYIKEDLMDLKKVSYLLPSALAGMCIGYFIGNLLEMHLVKKIVALFAIFVAIKLIMDLYSIAGVKDQKEIWNVKRFSFLGFPMGLFSGILGISGGIIEVPLQRTVLKTSLKNAIANSTGMVFFTSILGIFLSLTHGAIMGTFDWHVPVMIAIFVIPGTILGAQLGAYLTIKSPRPVLKLNFAVLMLVLGVIMFV
ncbi:MAG: TSUP family transporter [Candidatus Scalindua sediminis]|nr:TSUP family transporter [Candidatus Scalindua sediminis]